MNSPFCFENVSAFSGREAPLLSLLLEEELDDHATKKLLWPRRASRASNPVTCAPLLSCSSNRHSYELGYLEMRESSQLRKFLQSLSQPD